MRMWMVDPRVMCRHHLLGEHVELHMLVASINKGRSLKGFVNNGLIQTKSIKERHDALVEEMSNRGYKHRSPIEQPDSDIGEVDEEKSLKDLMERCEVCWCRLSF